VLGTYIFVCDEHGEADFTPQTYSVTLCAVFSVQLNGSITAASGWRKRRVASGTVRSVSLRWNDEAASDSPLVFVEVYKNRPASVITVRCNVVCCVLVLMWRLSSQFSEGSVG